MPQQRTHGHSRNKQGDRENDYQIYGDEMDHGVCSKSSADGIVTRIDEI